MAESDVPIMKFDRVTTASAEYQELITYEPHPHKVGYIRKIEISITTASIGFAQLKIVIDGKEQFKDKLLAVNTTSFNYGGSLKVTGGVHAGIIVYIKSDGTNTIGATGSITGIEAP